MINDIIDDARSRMDKTIVAFNNELTKLRTGRAHPSLLEHIKVKYYDNDTPLNQVATVAVEGARTLTITPWEKAMIGPIEKAIQNSDLGLNPMSASMVIRVPLPALTEERRRDLARVVRDEAEKARVAIRNIRREANGDFKELQKEKEITEDQAHRAEADIQKVTDSFIIKVDEIASKKEADLMTV